jgi:hypothetical protein
MQGNAYMAAELSATAAFHRHELIRRAHVVDRLPKWHGKRATRRAWPNILTFPARHRAGLTARANREGSQRQALPDGTPRPMDVAATRAAHLLSHQWEDTSRDEAPCAFRVAVAGVGRISTLALA